MKGGGTGNKGLKGQSSFEYYILQTVFERVQHIDQLLPVSHNLPLHTVTRHHSSTAQDMYIEMGDCSFCSELTHCPHREHKSAVRRHHL